MKILLDENVDVRFKSFFSNSVHEVYTVRDMKWNGIKNGALLQLLAENGFDCWIVVDKNIPYQLNINQVPCLIVVIDVFRNTIHHLEPLVPKLLSVLSNPVGNKIIVIPEPKKLDP